MAGVGGDLEFLPDSSLDTRCLHHFGHCVLTAGDALRKELPVQTVTLVLKKKDHFNLLNHQQSNLAN